MYNLSIIFPEIYVLSKINYTITGMGDRCLISFLQDECVSVHSLNFA